MGWCLGHKFKDSLNNIFTFEAFKHGGHEVAQRLIPTENINASMK